MTLANSKLVPAAFWIGFLALGFATSVGGPAKRHTDLAHRPAKTAAVPVDVAQSEKPTQEIRSVARD
ncbi:hypothetical protein [Methylocystis parvus]|uniref:Uncharacterized protein n=1 Tax=Methylocystis parvus TaxID=134 RepID=A0A6B8M322_9HYPH|nr:hypothetical protein [Methylocystis parvus]QGM99307.1 hypothetical protein F7D14_18685 [Methylocystis parvus]WBK00303.1 hypothetical protein MMG94_00845 [Methylocystis parvus OBBP]